MLPACCGQKGQPRRSCPGRSMQVGCRTRMMVATISRGKRATQQVCDPPGGSPTRDLGPKEVAWRGQHACGWWVITDSPAFIAFQFGFGRVLVCQAESMGDPNPAFGFTPELLRLNWTSRREVEFMVSRVSKLTLLHFTAFHPTAGFCFRKPCFSGTRKWSLRLLKNKRVVKMILVQSSS